MRLSINGEARDSEAPDLEALWRTEAEAQGIDAPQGVAIALNGAVVRRKDWPATELSEGDRIEIVRAMQGG
jgi:sulfur carrier protein